jgi:hypothetical protein
MWSANVASELSLNEVGIKKVFAKYDSCLDNKPGSISLEEWQVFCADLKMNITPETAL